MNTHFPSLLIYTVTKSNLAPSIWAAILLFLLLLFRRPIIVRILSILGLKDAVQQKRVLHKIDFPAMLLLALLALMPFIQLIHGVYADIATKAAAFVIPFLIFHVVIQTIYFLIFQWYFEHRRGTAIPSVFFTVVMIAAYGAACLLLLDAAFGINVVPLLATSTIVTFVLSFALQDTLRNIFAGLTVTFEQSFRQGDWVLFRKDANNTLSGQIVEIGWRSTKIRTIKNNYIIIPNAQFTSNELINFNSPTTVHAREARFPVSLDVNPKELRPAMEKAAASAEGVLNEPKVTAIPVEMNSDHIVYVVRFWVDQFEKQEETKAAVIENVWDILIKMKALPSMSKS